MKKWLEDNKYELTIEEFLILVEKDKKDKKKAKMEREYDSDDYWSPPQWIINHQYKP